ncbi:MAG TPA: polyphosphate:AMP phosphotransferase [Holophagaceae bacterium]|nr:polyphosphate:AMP phosphotransferase [Holophagaceae bacterium]
MFEAVELGQKVSKEEYEKAMPELREALLEAQGDLVTGKPFAVIVIVGGVKGAGKREVIGTLNSWLDPRHVEIRGLREPSDEEKERPHMWRFWRNLPPKGRMSLYHGSWYTWPILNRVLKGSKAAGFERRLGRIERFERMLASEGVLVLKYWMHLSKGEQAKRIRALEKNPLTRWRVTDQDWTNHARYGEFKVVCERAIQLTSTAEAPWTLVEATDFRHQMLTVGRHMLAMLRARMDTKATAAPAIHLPPPLREATSTNVLRAMDLTEKVAKDEYEQELERCQGRLAQLVRSTAFQKRSVVMVFEGVDAAGKGGSIRRVVGALDEGRVKVVPVAAPTEEERAQPYLWRFWRNLPRAGDLVIFDRSWYGRVLVERVEGFCSDADWMRAYGEINDFEDQLDRNGTLMVKFWLQISQEEQLRRFQLREQTEFKRFKITAEDWRNREKWPQYEDAICDMLERTSTVGCPWTLVASEDKYLGRLQVLRTLVQRLEEAL